jgi:hypothetical protein
MWAPTFGEFMHIIPHNLLSDERMWAHSCCLTPPPHTHRSRAGTAGWGTWRMLWRVRERSRPSSPSQLWVAGPLSPYNVIIYLFCIKLLLYSKDVTFDPVPWFIICVKLGPSTPGDCSRPGLGAPKPGCDTLRALSCSESFISYFNLNVVSYVSPYDQSLSFIFVYL